jgi:cardiolipin synthase
MKRNAVATVKSDMKVIKAIYWIIVLVSATAFCAACATLPKVNKVIAETPVNEETPDILAARGFLTPAQSRAVIERLKQQGHSADLVERETDLMEAVSGSPLIKGNKVTLLVDGPATYAAMFRAVEDARDSVNMETFIFEGDEIGSKFADLLLKKQSEGVQVNIIYDSVGSLGTPESFFDRLKEGGIQVLEFNPVNPAKYSLRRFFRWEPIYRDHRKILVVDGKAGKSRRVTVRRRYHGAIPTSGSKGLRWRSSRNSSLTRGKARRDLILVKGIISPTLTKKEATWCKWSAAHRDRRTG